jgi:hypothetical protein
VKTLEQLVVDFIDAHDDLRARDWDPVGLQYKIAVSREENAENALREAVRHVPRA